MNRPVITKPLAGSARRPLIAALVLGVLTGLAALAACVTHDGHPPARHGSPSSVSMRPGSPSSASPASDAAIAVQGPPTTSNPLAFAKAFARTLWSYDTRHTTRAQYLAGLEKWLTKEVKYADRASVVNEVPEPLVWSRMRDNGQYATAEVSEAHMPAAFIQALNNDPEALTEAYAYAVTVSGHQSINWRGSDPGRGAETRMITLGVQCRPGRACALVGVLPNVAP